MNSIDSSRPIPSQPTSADIDPYGLSPVGGYSPTRAIAIPAGINAIAAIGAKQQRETEVAALVKVAAATTRQAEAELHNAVMTLRESVQGYLESSSDLNSD